MTGYLRKFKLTLKPEDVDILEHLDHNTLSQGLDMFDRTFAAVDQYFGHQSKSGKRRPPSEFSLFVKSSWERDRETLKGILDSVGTGGVMKHLSMQWKKQKLQENPMS
jgi:hypothetical protein